MLASVLLHVIEPSQPIDLAVNGVVNIRHRPLDHMQHPFVFNIDAINHARLAQSSGVARLAAARGIKRRAIERNRYCSVVALVYADDASIEFEQARIVVIESLGCAHDLRRDVIRNKN